MSEPAKAPAFVVIPEFVIKPDCLEEFLALAEDDASHSVADEPGCRQFDVFQAEGEPCRVLFYEVYDSRAAFDAHLQTPHFARFRDRSPALIKDAPPVRFASRRSRRS